MRVLVEKDNRLTAACPHSLFRGAVGADALTVTSSNERHLKSRL